MRAIVDAPHIAPRLVIAIADGIVAEPRFRIDLAGITHLMVQHTDGAGKVLVLIGEDDLLARLLRMVKIMSQEVEFLLFWDGVHPGIEVDDIGTVFRNHLTRLIKPHLIPFVARHQAAVHLLILGVVGSPCGLHFHVIVVVLVVERQEESHTTLLDSFFHLADNIALGSHPLGIEGGILRVPHGETIVMLTDYTRKTSPTTLEKFCPLLGIELLRFEHRDKVVVTELL